MDKTPRAVGYVLIVIAIHIILVWVALNSLKRRVTALERNVAEQSVNR